MHSGQTTDRSAMAVEFAIVVAIVIALYVANSR
jgi:hypothetical protein